MKRIANKKLLVGLVLCGGMLTQLGPCSSAFFNGFLASIDFCSILGPDCTLGPISPCGNVNIPSTHTLLLDCPNFVQPNTQNNNNGGGGGGGGTGGGAGS